MKRSTSYHGLGHIARCLLLELIDRYNGVNNGMIALGVREAAYELGVNQSTVSRAARGSAIRPDSCPGTSGKSASDTINCYCPSPTASRSPMPNGPSATGTGRPSRICVALRQLTVTKTVTMSCTRGAQKLHQESIGVT